jgi:hypothetical protein
MVGPASAGEFVLAMPRGIPESIDSLEFFWALEDAIEKLRGCPFQMDAALQEEAGERWKSGGTLGAWIAWIAGEIGEKAKKDPQA